jgi:hypothetical protein
VPKVLISNSRLKQLQAAEEYCSAARIGIVERGFVGQTEWPWLDRWSRLAGKAQYDVPKPCRATYCSSCKRRHVAGQHVERSVSVPSAG